MVSPPRDYPEQQEHQSESSIKKVRDDSSPITVSSVLDRLDSEQPVTDDMIHRAVNNLHATDTLKNYKKRSPSSLQSQLQRKQANIIESVRSFFKPS